MLWGYPSSPDDTFALITPWGQLAGAVMMFLLLGFVPCYIMTAALRRAGVLRIPREVEFAGLDYQLVALEQEQRQEFSMAERQEFQTGVKEHS